VRRFEEVSDTERLRATWLERPLATHRRRREAVAVPEPLIYREEVTAVMIALSDVVTLLKDIKELLIDEEEEEDGG
jgi:serine/threonine-protein kinase RIO1